MFSYLASHPVASAFGVIVITLVGRFIAQGYAVRKKFHNAPGPPHSWIWGHLQAMGEIVSAKDLPNLAHPHAFSLYIRDKYKLGRYFYFDLWPIADPILYIWDPDLGAQFTTEYASPKFRANANFTGIIAGPGDMVASSGPVWKKWRTIFNPGFAAQHLMSLVPGIVDESMIFATKMSGRAKKPGEAFRLEEEVTRLTVDIIGKVALDLPLGTQTGENEMVTALRDMIHLLPNDATLNPFAMYEPRGMYRRWKNDRIIKNYLGKIIDERFAQVDQQAADSAIGGKKQRKRTIMDLAIESFRKEETQDGRSKAHSGLDPEFKKGAIVQIRTFIFAGHDTTSSTICYALYLLQKNPATLARIRAEHEAVFGDISGTADAIKRDPHIINKLEYTTAVIKETLRLFPAASSTRTVDGDKFTIRDPKTGEPMPTVPHMLLWLIHWALQRDPEIWGESGNKFDPSRFMPENIAKLPEAYYRPFERGVRNCIGQDLAMIEARVVLALVVRRFDFLPAFDAIEELAKDGSWYAVNEKYRQGCQQIDGEEAYPVLLGTAKPREGMPMRVREASWK